MSESQITSLLERWGDGDRRALDEAMPFVYNELKRIAAAYMWEERNGSTLAPTVLVHEAYLRLIGYRDTRPNSRKHFYSIAAQAMRRVLVDHARQRDAIKRDSSRPALESAPKPQVDRDFDVLALDTALSELETLDPRKARIVELRYFGGLSIQESAEMLDLSSATVKREWAVARAWLYRAVVEGGHSRSGSAIE